MRLRHLIFLFTSLLFFCNLFANEKYILDQTHTAKEIGPRMQFIVIHFTHANLKRSLHTFTRGAVSTHYLIPEKPANGKDLIYQLVPDDLRAAHAGLSYWQGQYNNGQINLNATSIGIELVNLGYKHKLNGYQWFPYTDHQINLLMVLLNDLVKKYDIHPTRIIGHSDITPNIAAREGNERIDPGPLFPWEKLAKAGLGAWYDRETVNTWLKANANKTVDIANLQKNLFAYGYNIENTGILDDQTRNVLIAFQMHFRPSNYSGEPDLETFAIAQNLVDKYIINGKLSTKDQGDAD